MRLVGQGAACYIEITEAEERKLLFGNPTVEQVEADMRGLNFEQLVEYGRCRTARRDEECQVLEKQAWALANEALVRGAKFGRPEKTLFGLAMRVVP